jgi:hypothetical protein
MAIFSGKNTVVILGTTTVSAFVSQVTLNREVDAVEITTMSNADHVFLGGLNNDSVTIEFFNDFAASSVNDLVEAALGSYLNLKLVPVSGTVTATNPSYTMSCFVGQWQPINTSPETVATASVTWPVKALVKATS